MDSISTQTANFLPINIRRSSKDINLDTENNNIEIPKFKVINDRTTPNEIKYIPSQIGFCTNNEESEGAPPLKKLQKDENPNSKQAKSLRMLEEIEKDEKLFVRLVKLDVASNRGNLSDSNGTKHDKDQTFLSTLKPKGPTKKISKLELQRQNKMNINKTESLKMEELLLKKYRRDKERQASEETPKDLSNDSTSEVEVYEYEKTEKSVFETYERVKDENGQITFCCLLCPYAAENFKQMSLHYKFKHKETSIEEMHFCDFKDCNYKSVHKGLLKFHTKRHLLAADELKSEAYACKKCDKVFEQRKGFLIHLKHKHKDPEVQLEKVDYPCATCNFRTNKKYNLQAHIYRNHVPDNLKQKFTCNICGFETHYKDYFKKHLSKLHLNK